MTMRLVVWIIAIAACRDATRMPNKHDAAAISVPLADAAVVDAAMTPACKSSFECAPTEPPDMGPADCMHSCWQNRCYVFAAIRVVGEPCNGDKDGNEYLPVGAPPSATRLGFCDISNGIYCDRGRCAPRKPAGSHCRRLDHDGFECAMGTFCDIESETCKQAPGIGEPCGLAVGHRCAASAYCEPERMKCAARRRDGVRCGEGAECRSMYCDPDKLRCAKRPPDHPCPF